MIHVLFVTSVWNYYIKDLLCLAELILQKKNVASCFVFYCNTELEAIAIDTQNKIQS